MLNYDMENIVYLAQKGYIVLILKFCVAFYVTGYLFAVVVDSVR